MNQQINLSGTEFHKEFLVWLTSKAPDAVIGQPTKCCQCPLAIFLTEYAGAKPCHVWVIRRAYCIAGVFKLLPVWAIVFVSEVDKLARQTITAEEALALLGPISATYADRLEEVGSPRS